MDPYARSTTGTRFRYNPNPTQMDDDDVDNSESFVGILEIYVHNARNIHNICIYDNQDVYAKFSLTYNPDHTLSTRIVNGGGKNPEFNDKIAMRVAQVDAVVKCEIWMFSRARNLMEDQLLGFALVPVSQVIGKGEVSQDYSLSSTDLFHSPAGTVKLTLCLTPSSSPPSSAVNSSISSEVLLLDRKISEVVPVEYSRVEFPDINVVKQNQEMVSEYFDRKLGSFLHLGNFPHLPPLPDCEMTSDEHHPSGGGSISPGGSIRTSSEFMNSTATSFSDERNSSALNISVSGEGNQSSSSSGGCPDTPTSRKGSVIRDEKDGKEDGNGSKMIDGKYGEMFAAAAPPPALIPNINSGAEESAMQQQIVDMYMRSMQQFTESLAKMKLPMDLDKPGVGGGDLIQGVHGNSNDHNRDDNDRKKKDGSRVFYGSRAFF
ncbi:hypothetical protein LINPERHAP2_LOCUS29001 [Linum perenne]